MGKHWLNRSWAMRRRLHSKRGLRGSSIGTRITTKTAWTKRCPITYRCEQNLLVRARQKFDGSLGPQIGENPYVAIRCFSSAADLCLSGVLIVVLPKRTNRKPEFVVASSSEER